jgi:hypothetical protein
MKIKAGVNFHNRFDVVRNGEWVGYAENIILDQMYNRICNLSTYFANIHFGTGSGTPTPDRTSLFSHLGTKTAVLDEIVKAFPTSKVTKRITIMPEEYVGQTITEVGVAYGSAASYLETHAMIKDSEGNPLSISKTALDVIEIYATIFITFTDTSSTFYFADANLNLLVKYFTEEESYSSILFTDRRDFALSRLPVVLGVNAATGSVSVDTVAKTRTATYRFGIGTGNGVPIRAVGLKNITRALLMENGLENPVNLSNVVVGIGDGVKTEFELPHAQPYNVSLKLDGVATQEYTLSHVSAADEPSQKSLLEYIDYNEPVPNEYLMDGFNGFTRATNLRDWLGVIKTTQSLEGLYINQKSTNYGHAMALRASEDGINFTQILSRSYDPIPRKITHPGPYYEIELYYSYASGNTYNVVIEDLDNTQMPKVTFVSPPSQDVVITADYTLDYLPKSSDYVLDVAIVLQFGEGV